jgi:hypothetical protein
MVEERDPSIDASNEELWCAEVQRRYDAYVNEELEALPGDEVVARARSRIK